MPNDLLIELLHLPKKVVNNYHSYWLVYEKPVVNHPGSSNHLLADCPAIYIIDQKVKFLPIHHQPLLSLHLQQ